jgi:hypothetical protein
MGREETGRVNIIVKEAYLLDALLLLGRGLMVDYGAGKVLSNGKGGGVGF